MEIKIRHAEPDDYQALHAIMAQPHAYMGTLQMPYPSRESWRKRLETTPENFYNLVAVVDGEIVGSLGLHVNARPRLRHSASLGIAVLDTWQGRGVGTALLRAALDLADNWFNLLRVELQVYVDNDPAIHLYRKFGFEIEGTLRCHAYRDGEYVDTHAMARLRTGPPPR